MSPSCQNFIMYFKTCNRKYLVTNKFYTVCLVELNSTRKLQQKIFKTVRGNSKEKMEEKVFNVNCKCSFRYLL